jgi:hypothetical protein
VRIPVATILTLLCLGSLPATAADDPSAKKRAEKPAAKADAARGEKPDPAREAAALEFVRENHPELAELLEQLKAMKPDQYERAIAELSQASRTLATIKKNDEQRYRLALEAWKAKSRADLLAAELVGTPGAELESQLRTALQNQIDAEIKVQRLERETVSARLRKLDETIKNMESRRDSLVESRYQALVKKGQRARRQEAAQTAPPASAGKGKKGED